MRWDRIEQGWKHITHRVCARWDLLSEAEVRAMNGRREALAQAIIKHYKLPADQVEWQISTWQNSYSDYWLYEEHTSTA